MPLPGPVGRSPGGLLWLEYRNPLMGERHQLFLHVAWFDQAPSGPDNDRAYVSGGPVTPTESGVLATFAAFGALWAPYFTPDFSLHIDSLHLNSAGTLTALPETPVADPIVGTDTTHSAGLPCTERRFQLLGRQGARRRLHLHQVLGNVQSTSVEVSPSSGGFDARDRAVMGYLSGASGGGVVLADGTYAFGVSDVSAWWARRLEPAPAGAGAGGDGAIFADDCLVWPLGGKICNPAGDVMTLETPGGHFAFDDMGLTLPGGHRLEAF